MGKKSEQTDDVAALRRPLVVAVSSRALFDMTAENRVFEEEGLDAYSVYQREHEDDPLASGAGYPLVKALLDLDRLAAEVEQRLCEVVIFSHNSADTGLRIFKAIEARGLEIKRAVFTSGGPVAKYLHAFNVDLFLSADEVDVRAALAGGVASAVIYERSLPEPREEALGQIRIAFDGDAVLFDATAEQVYQAEGLEGFERHEKQHAREPLSAGPFAQLLRTLSYLQHEVERTPPVIQTALVTARGCPSHERVIRTLRAWNVRLDETFFLSGMDKTHVLEAFGAHIFFDDQAVHCDRAADTVPTARVPSTDGTQV